MQTLNNYHWLMINDIIYKINSIKNTRDMQKIFLNDLRVLVPYDSATFYLPEDLMGQSMPVSVDVPLEAIHAYQQSIDDDYTKWVFNLSQSNVYKESDLLSEEERTQSEFYNKMYKRFDVHYAVVISLVFNSNFIGCLNLYRSANKEDFSDREIYVIELLKEHLALNLSNRLYGNHINIHEMNDFAREINLTKKESEVMELLVNGFSTEEMSRKLFISPNTLKNHLQSIYAKAGVKNRMQLLKIAHLI